MEFTDFLKQVPVWITQKSLSSVKGNDEISLYSAIRVARNYNDIVYPDKISGPQLLTVETLTDRALELFIATGKVIKINLESLTDNEVLVLSEKRLLPYLKISERNFVRLYIMTDSPVFLLVNYKDHLTFFAFAAKSNFKKARQNLNKLLKQFDDKNFQKNQEYGYLTSDLNFTGSGTKYFMISDLPYLRYASKIFQVTSAFKHNGMLYTRFFNQGSDLEDFLVIANKDSFSISEEDMPEIMAELHQQLAEQENERKMLFEDQDVKIVLKKTSKMLERNSFTFKNYLELYFSLSILADRRYDKRIDLNWLRNKLYEYQPGHFALKNGKLLSQTETGTMIAKELHEKFNFLL